MPNPIVLRGLSIAALLLVSLVAGIVGGMNFAPDVAFIRQMAGVRASAPDLTMLAIILTQAGSVYVTFGSAIAATGWLGWHRNFWLAGMLAGTVILERLTLDGMKLMIDRSRPSFDLHPVATHSSSFPSGHAGNSMAVFLAIALIAVPRAHRRAAVIAALMASFVVGLTRPFLGVHWLSDVIGGWALGAAVAITAATLANSRRSAAA
jgi:undecaprenyl-diphosphatase